MSPTIPAEEFTSLVRAHHAEVYRSARRIVGDDANALDVTQQVFLRVLEGKVALGEARDRGRLLCWLAARTALAHRRGARTRREQEGTHAMERPNTTGGADDEAQRAEVRDALQRQVALLPEELRTAVVLRFQEQWTFAQIADEQSISEPSAHDRVRRALELLRGRLTQTGFAAVAGDVPGLLLEASRATPADVPAGLEPRLLSLRAPAALAASAKLAAASLALVSVIAVAAAAAWWPESSAGEGGREWAGAVVSPTAPAATAAGIPGGLGTGGRAAVAVETASPARPGAGAGAGEGNTLDPDAPGKGVLAGRCVDGDRAPIAGVVVSALSLQHEGKFARFGASCVTGRDGQFALELPVSLETGEEYSLSTRHPDFVRHEHPKAVARLGVTVEVGPFELLSSSHDAAGESSLEVTVLDPAGLPVPHASVSSWRPVTGADGAPTEEREAHGETDASGRAVLELSRLGRKRLNVEPPAGEWGPASLDYGLDSAGRHGRTIHLTPGLTISGTVIGIGGEVIHGRGGFVAAVAEDGARWIQAETDDRAGTFVIPGLADRSYRIVRDGDEWSRVELPAVRAGTTGLVLQLKREDDPRDIGDHQAELHGEVRDARTGEILDIGAFDVSAVWLGDTGGADWRGDVLPGLVFPRPVQTAMFGEYVPPKAFHLDGLRPGRYALSARMGSRGEYGPAFLGPFELGERDIVSGLVIEVTVPGLVHGVLTDPEGRPLAGGFVRLTGFGPLSRARDVQCDAELRATRGRGAIGVWDDVRVDEEGRFEFPCLPAGLGVRFALHHPDFEFAYSGAVEPRAGESLDLGSLALGPRR
ncbi:MAG: sigma-70 family RNA polymerase sigma factor [Planctomycetes bacterium]|nr:sigma-70 family RNA polymerase sigma factor [Planctomycetota bacterium]